MQNESTDPPNAGGIHGGIHIMTFKGQIATNSVFFSHQLLDEHILERLPLLDQIYQATNPASGILTVEITTSGFAVSGIGNGRKFDIVMDVTRLCVPSVESTPLLFRERLAHFLFNMRLHGVSLDSSKGKENADLLEHLRGERIDKLLKDHIPEVLPIDCSSIAVSNIADKEKFVENSNELHENHIPVSTTGDGLYGNTNAMNEKSAESGNKSKIDVPDSLNNDLLLSDSEDPTNKAPSIDHEEKNVDALGFPVSDMQKILLDHYNQERTAKINKTTDGNETSVDEMEKQFNDMLDLPSAPTNKTASSEIPLTSIAVSEKSTGSFFIAKPNIDLPTTPSTTETRPESEPLVLPVEKTPSKKPDISLDKTPLQIPKLVLEKTPIKKSIVIKGSNQMVADVAENTKNFGCLTDCHGHLVNDCWRRRVRQFYCITAAVSDEEMVWLVNTENYCVYRLGKQQMNPMLLLLWRKYSQQPLTTLVNKWCIDIIKMESLSTDFDVDEKIISMINSLSFEQKRFICKLFNFGKQIPKWDFCLLCDDEEVLRSHKTKYCPFYPTKESRILRCNILAIRSCCYSKTCNGHHTKCQLCKVNSHISDACTVEATWKYIRAKINWSIYLMLATRNWSKEDVEKVIGAYQK